MKLGNGSEGPETSKRVVPRQISPIHLVSEISLITYH